MISIRCPQCNAWLHAETRVDLAEFDESHVFWCHERCRLRDFDEFSGRLLEEFGNLPMAIEVRPDERRSSGVVTPSVIERWLEARGFPGWRAQVDGHEMKLVPPVLAHPIGFRIAKVER